MDMVCSTHQRFEKEYTILVRKSEEKTPLGRSMHRWKNNI
jgi:hypothetical protein